MSKHIRYVIVVHGIGTQRKNETVINVVNRFAEARRGPGTDRREVLSLGRASGQTGTAMDAVEGLPWMEFDGIPRVDRVGDAPTQDPFVGETATSGENLRFVDLCWSDVLEESASEVVEEPHLWAQSLIGRLQQKRPAVPRWIRGSLEVFADAVLLVRFGMNFRFKEMKDLIFTKFLGDVQQYGEYPRCRGRSTRRFHALMAAVETAHRDRVGGDLEARYTIIAHSLGTIMSMDALLYAHTTRDLRCGGPVANFPNLPFQGYVSENERQNFDTWVKLSDEEQQAVAAGRDFGDEKTSQLRELSKTFEFLDTSWINRVDAFVTLGSPIDKYLVMWWLNYHYLTDTHPWFQPRSSAQKIYHWNYCDEQDPVGHNLDVARSAPGFSAAFDTCQDVVFNRYDVPGVAHNAYWKDRELFSWILAKTVDLERASTGAPQWFTISAYKKLLTAHYTIIPYLVIVLDSYTLSLALQAKSVHSAAIATAVFVLVAILGRKLIDLSIWWRQINRLKSEKQWRDKSAAALSSSGTDGRDPFMTQYGYSASDFDALRRTREARVKAFWLWTRFWLTTNVVLGGLIAGMHAATWPARWHWQSQADRPAALFPRMLLIAVIAVVTGLAYRRLVRLNREYRSTDSGWWVSVRTALIGCLPILAIGLVTWRWTPPVAKRWLASFDIEGLFFYAGLFFVVSGIVHAYRWARFRFVKRQFQGDLPDIRFKEYATK